MDGIGGQGNRGLREAAAPPGGGGLLPLLLLPGWLGVTLAWWALAFLNLTPATPGWLARTQSVCFGNLSNGLPDTYGWMKLILPPLALLAILLTVYWNELRRGWRVLRGHPLGWLLPALALAAVSAEGAWVAGRVREGLAIDAARSTLPRAAQPFPADYPRLGWPAPDFRLVDQSGAIVSGEALRGQVTYLTFAFGNCAATCPLTVRSLVQAARSASPPAARMAILTLDPWRDTPGALPSLAVRWELPAGGRVLSGTVEEVTAALDRFGVPRSRDLTTGDIAHPPLVYVIDPAGTIVYALNNPSPQWIVAAGEAAAAQAPAARR